MGHWRLLFQFEFAGARAHVLRLTDVCKHCISHIPGVSCGSAKGICVGSLCNCEPCCL